MRQQTVRLEAERRYPMSRAEAWRLLADTDHLNRTIGLPPVEFSPLPDPLIRGARARAFGLLPVRWREFPFEWVREHRYVVRREFESGPVSAAEVGIELRAEAETVTVRSFAEFTAPGLVGPALRRLGRGPVTDLLDFCDRYLKRRATGKADPVPVPERSAAGDTDRLDALLTQLRAAPVRTNLITPLRERIVEGSDDQLVRVRPYALADAWHADRRDVLRLMLYATRCGVFELRWELMCPNCRVPKQEVDSLRQLPAQFHCDLCGISYGSTFDQGVELRFTIHPAIRAAGDEVYCVGGPLRMPHIAAQQYLRSHEERKLMIRPEQPLHLRTVGSTWRLAVASAPPNPRVPEVKVTYADGRWTAPHSLLLGDTLTLPEGSALSLRNHSGGPVLAVLEDAAWTRDATTAAEVSTLQEFRDLFSSEVLVAGQQHAIRHLVLLFSDLKGSTRLYEGIGDAAAYSRVNRHFDFIKQAVTRRNGSVVKTLGDGVMCAFQQIDDALDAAIQMQQEVTAWCTAQGIDPPLVLKLGIHLGPVIAMTANDRLDYFGRTVNIAARLGEQSRGNDVVLTRDVFEMGAVRVTSGRRIAIEPFTARLRGLDTEQRLVRVTVGAPASSATERVDVTERGVRWKSSGAAARPGVQARGV
jgi:class 3 adenylate cyclase